MVTDGVEGGGGRGEGEGVKWPIAMIGDRVGINFAGVSVDLEIRSDCSLVGVGHYCNSGDLQMLGADSPGFRFRVSLLYPLLSLMDVSCVGKKMEKIL